MQHYSFLLKRKIPLWLRCSAILAFCCLSLALDLHSQSGHIILNDGLRRNDIISRFMADKKRDHLAVKPWSIRELPKAVNDTASSVLSDFRDLRFWQFPDSTKVKVSVLPIVDLSLGYSNKADGLYAAYAGLAVFAQLGKSWSIYVDGIGGSERLPEYLENFTEERGILPAYGKNLASDGQPTVFLPSARVDFAPNEFFQFELGFGRNFIGNGYRSFFLSDISYAYPYLKIETDFWQIKYTNLFTAMKGLNSTSLDPTDFRAKYSSIHYLSWAATPRFNIGLFEAVVWQGEDVNSERGFDVNYINPIIFFRPVEYSIGSPDNSLIGLDMSFKASKEFLVYGQFLLDEFLLSAFREGNGWWGNKWAAQIGVNMISSKNWQAFGEFNLSRPFTYTHGSVLQNYAHYNQPLAHPLGANFYETLLGGQYSDGLYYGEYLFMWANYGRDPLMENLGGNIFKSYVNPTKQYENYIGQGILHSLVYQRAEVGLILGKQMPIKAGVYGVFRNLQVEQEGRQNEFIIGLRVSANIYNSYRDF